MEEKIKTHLKSYRAQHNKTQKEMAAYLEVSYSTYQEMENGIIKSLKVLDKLKEKTGFKSNAIFMDNEADNSSTANDESITLETIRDLARSGIILAEANRALVGESQTMADVQRILAITNQEQTEIIKKLTNKSSGPSKETETMRAAVASTIQKIAQHGVGDLWQTVDEGIVKLGKLFVGDYLVKH